MRWNAQRAEGQTEQALLGLPGLLRSVRSPEFSGVTFHEVCARSVLNKVPGASRMPFRWTVNPYRGCSHACTYCYARGSHTYLDLDPGRDFDTQVVVKVNAPEVLAAQLRRPSWTREHVAMGTNTDPYQRAEGRYRLMPGIIKALGGSGTPFSILTKGTVLTRDLPLLRSVAADVPVGLGVSLALLDRDLQQRLEPGTPTPRARLDLVRRAADAGLPCGVFVAPVLPWLTDTTEALDRLLAAVAGAGATGVTVIPLHLRPGAREWFTRWLGAERPELVPRYRELYRGGSYADRGYRRALAERVAPLVRRHGLDRRSGGEGRGVPGDENARWPAGSMPPARGGDGPAREGDQLSLL
ncbi:Rv2578c family radical SAM protein [Prauserella shujinwangii]|uniref:Rv2578c family radical SAM protein n=1 Tax=Prauserella shujinwangii TaxID=1453103 RepID=UPI000D05425A|nr:Rv2578c family radical SAM protein [Prauserella shujinwangii]